MDSSTKDLVTLHRPGLLSTIDPERHFTDMHALGECILIYPRLSCALFSSVLGLGFWGIKEAPKVFVTPRR